MVASTEEKYQGAHVEEPVQGYYTDPILTVDFASLYPSLMRTYNLSPDTLLDDDEAEGFAKKARRGGGGHRGSRASAAAGDRGCGAGRWRARR